MRTTTVVAGTITGMDDLARDYRALVERIGGYPMSGRAKAVIVAEIKAIYLRERAAMEARIFGPAPNGRDRARPGRSRFP